MDVSYFQPLKFTWGKLLILFYTTNKNHKIDDLINRVGRGITPPPSHTTVRTLVYGGFKLIL
ncbi:hypothetical protein BZG01_20975 [Labilibaculum manganireducens]|uniref:Uncharacterized protein n=1 Tax=Labilibaculum manganireducens TaxID=1940525 RepID=A0A2N3HQW9_9BACT|nr:hypothetical protein BZG01_20975 [Labilibaculum manganireducens]